MALKYNLITWLLIPLSVRSTDLGQRINTTAILTEYILVCGFDYLCYPSSLPLLPKPTGYDHIIKCPTCSCKMDCVHYNSCCPDMVLRYPEMSCVGVSLSDATQGDIVLMVASCPHGTEDNKACVTEEYNNANKITQVPVSSSTETVVFKNIECATCHGQKSNLTKWKFEMECERIVDINHMSTYDEIFQAGLDNTCNMNYHSSRLHDHFRCSPVLSTGLKKCNMTGQWTEYDSHVDWACRNFQKPYRGFENVFCFACNPGKRQDDRQISACNKTGMWNPYDSELEKACVYYPASQITYPYKNKFCYLCNRRNNVSDIFMDAKTSIEQEMWKTNDNIYEMTLGIKFFRQEYVYHADITRVNFNSTATLSDDHFGTYKNVSKLLFLYYLHYGNQGRCPDRGDETHQQCTCSLLCVRTSRCCAEFALSGPVVNTNEFKHSLSVSKCYRKDKFNNSTLQEKCETTLLSKGIFQIPVRSRNSNVLYRNVYCFLCNEGQKTTSGPDTESEYDPLDLHFRCNFTFITERYIFLEDMLKDFDRMEGEGQNCTVSTIYDRFNDMETVPDTIDKCNVTGEWDIFDSDLEWACLNYNHDITSDYYFETFKNIFCEMCNKALDTDLAYTSCDNNSTIGDDCESYPQVTSMKPYKNIFCKICNSISPLTNLTTAVDVRTVVSDVSSDRCSDRFLHKTKVGGRPLNIIKATVRDLFSISVAPEFLGGVDNVIDTYGNHCLGNEIYDMDKSSCITQECADGKMLIDGKCIPLLQLTTSLGYTLALKITGSVLVLEDIVMETILHDLKRVVYDILIVKLNSPLSVLSTYVSVPSRCTQAVHRGDRINVTMTFYTSFYLQTVVNRFDVESKLINITSSTIRNAINKVEVDLTAEIHPSALDLPGNVVLLDFKANCFRVEQRNLTYDNHAYKLKFVSKLLLCPRVRIQKERYEIDDRSRSMKLLPDGPVLAFGNYELLVNTTAIICVEDFTDMMDGRTSVTDGESMLSSVLSMVSFLCTCLSILCLIITFLTYCFFAELRTIPGKNNMYLIVSLFFSQCLMQFGMKQTQHTHLCIIIAIFIHFFWLSTFFSMNVCSFHMYRVFVFPLFEAKRVHRWTCFWYACYIFGMSALIVTVYIALSVTVFDSDNLGYTGNGKCFLTSFESVIATFLSPVLLVCLSNAIFFVVVTYKISTAPIVPSTRDVRKEYPLYVKLFVLTGVTWLLQIIDAFIPLSVFSIISGIVNSSQGIFIFFSYSTNSRVRKFYKDRFSTRISDTSRRKKEFVERPSNAGCDDENMDSRI